MEYYQMGATMILPDFVLPSQINQTWQYTGIDDPDQCLDKKHFESYPHDITYNYNSRGFRDAEWPDNPEELQSAIWCVGDSFTVGLGSPLEHTWVYQLSKQLNRRTINVSMDGASNMWIARKSLDIVNKIKPAHLIIQWSYVTRRESTKKDALERYWPEFYKDVADPSWPPACSVHNIDQLPKKILEEIYQIHGWQDMHNISDERRKLHMINCTVEDDIRNTLDCIESLSQAKSTQIVHSFIPNFVLKTHQGVVESQINGLVIPEILRLDIARDGHHYDIATSQEVVRQMLQYLR
jgi:hypothetical protein